MTTAIIDYGSGNLHSAAKAFERASAAIGSSEPVVVSRDAGVIRRAARIVLPGVGSFADCRRGLHEAPGVIEMLQEAVLEQGRPFLGICVGMQLLASAGHEDGVHKGLDWIAGEVVAVAPSDPALKVPHMGWNDIELMPTGRRHPVFEGIPNRRHGYFVHSYRFQCVEADHVLARVDYGGAIAAAVGRDNIVGVQFHPEKSQALGLGLIENFLRWQP
ncbi:MAG: imidazole glycerol phosphate synthase subunit HisH [Sphingomonadales bacterium]